MKKTKMTRSLLAACSIVALTAVMYGCVHDGGDDAPTMDGTDTMEPPMPAPTPVSVTLPNLPTGPMYAVSAGTREIAAGGSATNGGVSFMCASGGEACVVTVAADGTASSTGGTVTASLTAAAKTAYDMQKTDGMAELEGRASGLHSALTDANGIRGVQIRANEKNADFMISRGLTGMAMVSDDGQSGLVDDAHFPPQGLPGHGAGQRRHADLHRLHRHRSGEAEVVSDGIWDRCRRRRRPFWCRRRG